MVSDDNNHTTKACSRGICTNDRTAVLRTCGIGNCVMADATCFKGIIRQHPPRRSGNGNKAVSVEFLGSGFTEYSGRLPAGKLGCHSTANNQH